MSETILDVCDRIKLNAGEHVRNCKQCIERETIEKHYYQGRIDATNQILTALNDIEGD
jgi:hypothetical protein